MIVINPDVVMPVAVKMPARLTPTKLLNWEQADGVDGEDEAGAKTANEMTLKQWRKGLLRLYIVVAVPWTLWFGYAAYEANRVYSINRDYVEALNKEPDKD
jgi:hypothetical protein